MFLKKSYNFDILVVKKSSEKSTFNTLKKRALERSYVFQKVVMTIVANFTRSCCGAHYIENSDFQPLQFE